MPLTLTQFLLEDNKSSGKFFTVSELRSNSRQSKIAKKLGVSLSDLNKLSDHEITDIIKNIGEHDFTPNHKFNPKELALGIKIEREHTKSNVIATLIAKDHLAELPNYYTKLAKMEGKNNV